MVRPPLVVPPPRPTITRMKPLSRTVRVVVNEYAHAPSLPEHPSSYEISEPGEVREVVAAVAEAPSPPGDFVCMCQEQPRIMLYEAAGQLVRSFEGLRPVLLDPASPGSLPGRHRAAWAAAAPEPLRAYAESWARGETVSPGDERAVPLSLVFRWLGTPPSGLDAARLLARRAPLALLEAAKTEDLAWAVREADPTGLDGAVEFFASEAFTARHPKRRRVGGTARELLLRHARRRSPRHLAVLERRLLLAAEDHISR